MKLKELVYFLGLRPRPQTYGYQIEPCILPIDGQIDYAIWKHPKVRPSGLDQDDINELRTFLKPGDVAIDIGAHTGDSTLPIALAVGHTGCVLAFEPNSYVFPVLEQNARLNTDKTCIIPLMYAATNEDGTYEFEYSDPGFCNGGYFEQISKWRHGHAFKLQVTGKNVQQLLEKDYQELITRIRYIKVDAEGYDYVVLQTLSDLIARNMPFIKTEVYKRTTFEQRLQLFNFLTRFGYRIHRIEDEHHYHGEVITEGRLMAWSHYDIFCMPASAI